MQALLEHFITQSTLYSLIAVLLVAFLESLALVGLILPGTVLMAGLGALIGSGAASRVSVMTVKTSDTCSSRRRSQLVCKRMPGADKPVRARQRVLAGVGAQP